MNNEFKFYIDNYIENYREDNGILLIRRYYGIVAYK